MICSIASGAPSPGRFVIDCIESCIECDLGFSKSPNLDSISSPNNPDGRRLSTADGLVGAPPVRPSTSTGDIEMTVEELPTPLDKPKY
jgi:hypothetical protein